MNLKTPAILTIITILLSLGSWAEGFKFQPLADKPASDHETFFKVENGEAAINGSVIKLIVVKPEHLSVSYKNDSDKEVYPKYTVRIYNRYGCLLGGDKVSVSLFGGSSQLEPGDVGGEKLNLKLVDITSILKHTGLDIPADFHTAAWLSISESNTRLVKKGDTDEATTVPEAKSKDERKSKPESKKTSR